MAIGLLCDLSLTKNPLQFPSPSSSSRASMGCSSSSQRPATAVAAAAAAGAQAVGEGDAARCSGLRIRPRRSRKKQQSADEKKKGGFFDRKVVGPGRGEDGEGELHRVPGRMILNGASEVACLFTQQGKKGTNQDAMIVWEDFTSITDTIFCGVFDGHGPLGHMVARKVRDSLPLKLCKQWKAVAKGQENPQKNDSPCKGINSEGLTVVTLDEEWSDTLNFTEDEKLPEIYIQLKKCFLKSFKMMDKELKLLPTTDCFCSGSTAVTLVKQGQDLIIGNLGDSRAILGTRDKNNNLVALQLTVDLKPNLPKEAARIEQCKGRVFALQDEPEVARVWLPNSNSPGLAMARAFGDFCLKDYGLISVPDMSYRHLTDKDEFVVLATDGIWDVLSNKEVVDIVASAPTQATAARAIVDSAIRAWRLKFPTSKIDDCAAICLFFGPPSANSSKENEPSSQMKACSLSSKEQLENEVIQGSFKIQSPVLLSSDEIIPVCEDPKSEQAPVACRSAKSLADCISNKEEEEWSALEGVTRVNSLLNLPRFFPSEKRSNSRRKWP